MFTGSHGVWGLDDYHCLTFVYGASQLSAGQDTILPSSINDNTILTTYSTDYFYIEGIQFIKKVKSKAPFHETSPMLYDISSLPDWSKVHLGLLRLFQGEVLNKLPIVQHIPFGSILRCTWTPSHSTHNTGAGPLTEDHIKSIQASANGGSPSGSHSGNNSPASASTTGGTGGGGGGNSPASALHHSPYPHPPIHHVSSNTSSMLFDPNIHTTAPWANRK